MEPRVEQKKGGRDYKLVGEFLYSMRLSRQVIGVKYKELFGVEATTPLEGEQIGVGRVDFLDEPLNKADFNRVNVGEIGIGDRMYLGLSPCVAMCVKKPDGGGWLVGHLSARTTPEMFDELRAEVGDGVVGLIGGQSGRELVVRAEQGLGRLGIKTERWDVGGDLGRKVYLVKGSLPRVYKSSTDKVDKVDKVDKEKL